MYAHIPFSEQHLGFEEQDKLYVLYSDEGISLVAAQTGIDAIVDQDTHPLPLKSGLSNKTRKDEAFR